MAQSLSWKLDHFKQSKIAERLSLDALVGDKRDAIERMDEKARALLNGRLMVAGKRDYDEWLTGYMAQGNEPTHYYEYPWSRVAGSFFVATKDFELPPLFGVSAISLIVPKSVKFLGGGLGHSRLYFEDGYTMKGEYIVVPVYQDTYVIQEIPAPLNDQRKASEVMG